MKLSKRVRELLGQLAVGSIMLAIAQWRYSQAEQILKESRELHQKASSKPAKGSNDLDVVSEGQKVGIQIVLTEVWAFIKSNWGSIKFAIIGLYLPILHFLTDLDKTQVLLGLIVILLFWVLIELKTKKDRK